MIGLYSQSLWTLEMSLRGGRQQTWQPLSPHQAVDDCDAHPRDHSMLSMRGDKLIKAIIAQMVSAFSSSKAVSVEAQHLAATLEKTEKVEGKTIRGVVGQRMLAHSHLFRLILTLSCHTIQTGEVCVGVRVCIRLWVHVSINA